MAEAAPMREVTRVLEMEGPRGGIVLVLILECDEAMDRRIRTMQRRRRQQK